MASKGDFRRKEESFGVHKEFPMNRVTHASGDENVTSCFRVNSGMRQRCEMTPQLSICTGKGW